MDCDGAGARGGDEAAGDTVDGWAEEGPPVELLAASEGCVTAGIVEEAGADPVAPPAADEVVAAAADEVAAVDPVAVGDPLVAAAQPVTDSVHSPTSATIRDTDVCFMAHRPVWRDR